MSRRTALAVTAMVVGLVVIAFALVGGSSSSGGNNAASSTDKKVDPVEPINPKDKDALNPRDEDEKAFEFVDPFFSTSFGASARREVTVQVTANGYVNVAVYYRDRDKPRMMVVRSYSATRTFKGRFPMAAIAMQLPGNLPGAASRATCTVTIDGVKFDSKSTTKPGALKACAG